MLTSFNYYLLMSVKQVLGPHHSCASPAGAPSSWLWPCPAPAVGTMWGTNQRMELLPPPPLSLPLCDPFKFLKKKSFIKTLQKNYTVNTLKSFLWRQKKTHKDTYYLFEFTSLHLSYWNKKIK